ncbi:jg11771 [Pararge aegeria aegeria]|uniref:Jg11771 protein n=1 Tax=Pararge aegeria aegeria TaxID=348720 RepID=A0A8S4R202_9NEOP|nr:jg11771 [Pararge aegeria aegeria]
MVSDRPPLNGGVGTPRPRTFRRNCGDQVSVTSPSKVYINTSAKCTYYSENDETPKRVRKTVEDKVKFIEVLEQTWWLSVRTVLRDGEFEIQDLVAFIECDSSDSGHFYESLEPAAPHLPLPPVPPIPLEDDFDSFDSDSDTDDHDKTLQPQSPPALPASRLPNPPIGGGPYTLTKIANAAQRKMRQIKRNLTKRYSVAMDGKPFTKSSGNQNGTYDVPKNHPKTKSPNIYANYEKPEIQHVYSNVNFNDTKNALNKAENPLAKMTGTFKEELKTVIGEKGGIKTGVMDRGVNKSGVEKTITKAAAEKGVNRSSLGEKRNSNGDVPPPLPDKPPPEKPTTPTSDTKSSGTLSRKAYFSFKSRFRRATSMAVDINSDVPSALKITNSTFYLTDSMDGDSGFSNW